jgi:O-antigen/teichoic acid export membrane protein
MPRVKDSLIFSLSRYALMALGLLRNFVIGHALGPEAYGSWVIVVLVLSYGDQLHLGLRHAGDKEIPYWRSAANETEALRIANAIYGGILIQTGVLVLLVGIVGGIHGFGLDLNSWFMLGLILFSDQVSRFHFMIFRAFKEFMLSSTLEVSFEFVRTITVSILAAMYQFEGALGGTLLASLLPACYLAWKHRRRVKPLVLFHSLRRLWTIGFSLLGCSLLFVVILNIDRVVASMTLSKTELGLYGMAAVLAQLPLSISQSIAAVLFPSLSEQFGKEKSARSLQDSFRGSMTGVAYVAPFVTVSFFIVTELLVGIFLPAYRLSVALVWVLAFGMCFLCSTPVPMGVLIASGNSRLVSLNEIMALGIVAPLYTGMAVFSPDIQLLAVITSFGFVVFSILLFYRACNILEFSSGETWRSLLSVFIPSVGACFLLFAFPIIFGSSGFSPLSLLLGAAMKFLALFVAFAVMVWATNTQSALFRSAKEWVPYG